ncbi:hypothetical protein Lalb_Chr05g0223351 [Lupinus albus]|uniref:Uncharacterized protein n=1 Tax=Lupinus albus TaxID=3870 RepID=A0A6A4QKI3_LUPAL|nr:hypothetical protein Lalb_Chr05g0223351 [Lupinus albus]
MTVMLQPNWNTSKKLILEVPILCHQRRINERKQNVDHDNSRICNNIIVSHHHLWIQMHEQSMM